MFLRGLGIAAARPGVDPAPGREISCPGVFLPSKQYVYLGVYILNQYQETDCFTPIFPITIHRCMRFEKIFEKAIDPGTVVEHLESFLTRFELIQQAFPAREELAYYEENTRDFLFPEPKLTSPPSGMQREVLMKTTVGFPGIAPKLEFSTRTAIRECVLDRNNFFVDSTKPFGVCNPETHSQKSRTKFDFSNLMFPVRGASSLDDLTANIKIIKEPDERIILRSESPSPLHSSKFGKLSPSYNDQGDADFYRETSFAASHHSKSPIPLLDQPLLRERFLSSSQSTWKKIHERVCSLLKSHRAKTHLNENDSISEINGVPEKPSYPWKKYQLNE